MDYNQMVKETDELIRRVMLHNDIVTWGLGVMLAGLMIVLGWIAWTEHREKMKNLRAQREWEDIRETFSEGPYYRRM